MEGMGCCRDDLGGWRVGMEGRREGMGGGRVGDGEEWSRR